VTYRLLVALLRRYVPWRRLGTRPVPSVSALGDFHGELVDTASVGAEERDLTILYCGIRRYPFVTAR
jgi:hypothetical protein